jgi:hypothetical protein
MIITRDYLSRIFPHLQGNPQDLDEANHLLAHFLSSDEDQEDC